MTRPSIVDTWDQAALAWRYERAARIANAIRACERVDVGSAWRMQASAYPDDPRYPRHGAIFVRRFQRLRLREGLLQRLFALLGAP